MQITLVRDSLMPLTLLLLFRYRGTYLAAVLDGCHFLLLRTRGIFTFYELLIF